MSKPWQSFEANIKEHSMLQKIQVVKVPEIVRVSKGKSWRLKTEFDFCAGIDGISAFFDAKCVSTQGSYYLSMLKKNQEETNGSSCKAHTIILISLDF